jgi:hypothetical protein
LTEIVPIRPSLVPDQVTDSNDVALFETYDGVTLSPEEVAFANIYTDPERGHFSPPRTWCILRGKTKDTDQTGLRWYRKPHIQKAIAYRLEAFLPSENEALAELKDVAMSDWADHVELKTRKGEIVSVRMDLASKVRALEIILRAHNRLDNNAATVVPIQININVPGMDQEDLA